MVRKGSDKRLGWAFAVALLLHGAALAAAARLPLPYLKAGNLAAMQVFQASALSEAPLALVDLPTPSPIPGEMRNIETVAPATSAEAPVSRAPVARPPARERSVAAERRPRAIAVSPRLSSPHPNPSPGGGGGGPVDLGPGSAGGTVAASGGGTEPGSVPGQGSGQGSGEGTGRGGGSGTGAGGGEGAGTGTGQGGGTPEPGFVSRLADRAEPELIRKGRLVYPEAAIADGVEGTCVLKVLVGEKGEVIEAEVTRASGDRRLDQAALEFVRRWRYRPAVQDGKARRVSTRATVQFELN